MNMVHSIDDREGSRALRRKLNLARRMRRRPRVARRRHRIEKTYLLAFLDDALPQVLPTWQKILECVSHHLLDRLLRPASRRASTKRCRAVVTTEREKCGKKKTLTR